MSAARRLHSSEQVCAHHNAYAKLSAGGDDFLLHTIELCVGITWQYAGQPGMNLNCRCKQLLAQTSVLCTPAEVRNCS